MRRGGGLVNDFKNRILQGDCLEVLRTMSNNSIDSCVTDPPYGLSKEPDIREVLKKWMAGEDYEHRGGGFMGKSWDSFVPGPSVWREVYRVLKPGGHALVFAGTRTQDLMTISLRMAGFEVRDVVEWLYFQGFPKSLDVGKAFDKRAGAERKVIGVELKKAFGYQDRPWKHREDANINYITIPSTDLARKWDGWGTNLKPSHEPIIVVRKPLEGTVADNVEKYGTGAINIDGCRIEMSPEDFEAYVRKEKSFHKARQGENVYGGNSLFESKTEHANRIETKGRFPANCVTTEPDAFFSKYFNVTPPELCKKASKRDRNSDWRGEEIHHNNHPTVKPTDLMAWLVRLVTPPGGTVLDPFAGSGSTLVAAKREGFDYIGIEREAEYIEIARARTGETA